MMGVALGEPGHVDDGGIAEGAVAVLQSRSGGRCTALAKVSLAVLPVTSRIRFLLPPAFQLLHGVVQISERFSPDTPRITPASVATAFMASQLLLGRAVQDGLAVLADRQRGLGDFRVRALEDQRPVGGHGLLRPALRTCPRRCRHSEQNRNSTYIRSPMRS